MRSRRWVVGLVVPVAAVAVAGVIGAIVATTAICIGPDLLRRQRDRTAAATRRRSVPAALDLLVVAIDAGLTPQQSVELLADVGPITIRPSATEVIRRTERGVPLSDALASLVDALGPPIMPTVDALTIAHRHGAPLSDALHVTTAEATRQRRAQLQAAARRLPVRLSFPLVVCVLPAFVLLAIVPAVLAALASFESPGW